MSKYTAEQVIHAADLEQARYDGDLIISEYLRDYASLLRERESAKAAVTDEIVIRIARALEQAGWATGGDFEEDFLPDVRAALEAVAPMLASAQVPERTSDMTKFVDGLGWVVRLSDVPEYAKRLIEQTRDLLAKTAKPEISERHHWLCCGALNHDHSDKPRVMPDCFDPERRVWAVSPKPKTEE